MQHRTFGHSGLRISRAILGTMTFGEQGGVGAPLDECRRILATYLDAGDTTIDTAANYRGGASEQFLGELLGDVRERLVLGTSIEETMRTLDDAVRAGKILYVGVPDTPAWLIARANTLADWRGWSAFIGIQVPYSLLTRDVERELLPMAAGLGLSVAAWSPLGGGLLTGKYTGKPGTANQSPLAVRCAIPIAARTQINRTRRQGPATPHEKHGDKNAQPRRPVGPDRD